MAYKVDSPILITDSPIRKPDPPLAKSQMILKKFVDLNNLVEERISVIQDSLDKLNPSSKPTQEENSEKMLRDDVPSVLGALEAQVNRLHNLEVRLSYIIQHLKEIV